MILCGSCETASQVKMWRLSPLKLHVVLYVTLRRSPTTSLKGSPNRNCDVDSPISEKRRFSNNRFSRSKFETFIFFSNYLNLFIRKNFAFNHKWQTLEGIQKGRPRIAIFITFKLSYNAGQSKLFLHTSECYAVK